ncbi:trans-sialidase [Trypanosoma theileri]|uniref:Trans-sialidase n=1 Tax=Trypanosoma theileri TaxID=67003 RepID=A0A1X0NNP8_9TRYP|nr:trans-sialidase [Trypanosoma theileri]ORC86221.1 trans-sialidase [Trypanosoma theileri]
MTHSLFVLLLILLLGCISGYAEEEEPIRRNFHGFHFLEFGNGDLVAIDGANLYRWNKHKVEYMELLTPASGEGQGAWWNPHRNWFRFYPSGYNGFPINYGSGTPFRAVFALVENNNPPSKEGAHPVRSKNPPTPEYSFIHIVWMNTLNGGIGENSFTYAPLILKFPFEYGTARVVRFPVDTISPILTTKNNTLVFPVQFVTEDNKTISSVMYYRPHDTKWKIGGALPDMDTSNPAVIEWENDKLMMIAQHPSGHYRVYESTDLEKTWAESTSTLSRVWSTSTVTTDIPTTDRGSHNNSITATIDGKRVILFTQSLVSGPQNVFYLWLTDNTHIYYVDFIATRPRAATSSLLFKNGELYFRYETVEESGKHKVFFVDLTTAMESIKSVVKKWTEQDQILTESRCCTDESCASVCRIPTIGLVGYLSGNIDGNKWKDEYLGVDASVSGITEKVTNGLKFMGPGSGAIWPVSTNVLARQYHFTNYAFTLVATVTIHKVPKNDSSPLLGVRMWDKNKHSILLGVSYNNDKTWSAINRGTKSKSTGTWEVDNESSLVLTFKNGTGSVYINSTRLHVGTNLNIEEVVKISHFYFGWDGESVEGSHISVKDVMLYNRVLSNEEIDVLLRSRMNISFSPSDAEQIQEETNDKSSQEQNTPQSSTTSTPAKTPVATVQPESQPESQENQQPAPVVDIPPEKTQQEVNTTENKTSTETTVPVSSTNTKQQDLLQNTTQSMINNNVNAHKNKSIDGTVRIYESVLPMLVLGLWALATVFP